MVCALPWGRLFDGAERGRRERLTGSVYSIVPAQPSGMNSSKGLRDYGKEAGFRCGR